MFAVGKFQQCPRMTVIQKGGDAQFYTAKSTWVLETTTEPSPRD